MFLNVFIVINRSQNSRTYKAERTDMEEYNDCGSDTSIPLFHPRKRHSGTNRTTMLNHERDPLKKYVWSNVLTI